MGQRLLAPPSVISRASVRTRLLLVALVPVLAILPILLFLIFYWGVAYYDRLLTFKVSSDLAVAHQYFIRVVDRIGLDISGLGASHPFVMALRQDHGADLQRFLAEKKAALNLDFLDFLDPRGQLLVSSQGGRLSRQNDANWPVVRRAIAGHTSTEIDVYDQEQLRRLGESVAQQARLELVATPNAAPTGKRVETRGMIIHSAAPVLDDKGRLLGIIEGGVLLNRNLRFVDTINHLVYPRGSLPSGSEGTATLFLDDVRIATNVRLFGKRRALGTRASQVVRDQVLGQGKTWLDRAFVVHDWYISAYEPIKDSFGSRVGMLYVGYLEAPFRQAKEAAIGLIVLLFASVCGAGVFFSLRVAREIYRPLKNMNRTMTAVEQGDLAARTGVTEGREELGNLARHLDQLLDTVQQQNGELKSWADDLDRKVVARTAELEQANQLLVATQRQLALSEKLAAIGEITAGVAHEINNPVAVMQGNLDVLRETLGDHAGPVEGELLLLDQQIQRIATIVTKLLQFASPSEFAGYVEPISADEAVADSLFLVSHLLKRADIRVSQHKGATRLVSINKNELQQVLINLFTNAIHAMTGGGELSIETSNWDDEASGRGGVDIRVADTGIGISKENLGRVFDAFFTTKHQGGTGLGLSISYTLVARYGGSISVDSREGLGTVFTVRLVE